MEHYSHYGSAYFIHEDVNQKLIDSVYETISSYSNTFDCRVAISQVHMVLQLEFLLIAHKL